MTSEIYLVGLGYRVCGVAHKNHILGCSYSSFGLKGLEEGVGLSECTRTGSIVSAFLDIERLQGVFAQTSRCNCG
jgi:hypothetical protein